jgi:hypothetical protein
MSEQEKVSKAASVSVAKTVSVKEDPMQAKIGKRIAELQKINPEAYKGLTVKEWYSLNESVAITGYSRAWLYRQVKKLQRYPSQAKIVQIKDEEGNERSAWRLHISLVLMKYEEKQGEIRNAQKVVADPKSHYKNNRPEQKSLAEQVKAATPEELAELRKLLGL